MNIENYLLCLDVCKFIVNQLQNVLGLGGVIVLVTNNFHKNL